MNISDLKKICEDAEAYRNQVWLTVDLPNGEVIELRVKDVDRRLELMHAFRRGGLTAGFHTLVGERITNQDQAGRKEPFWGTKGK